MATLSAQLTGAGRITGVDTRNGRLQLAEKPGAIPTDGSDSSAVD
jgi:threonine dehydrogenase-like Zn-dependent dehydrogenase